MADTPLATPPPTTVPAPASPPPAAPAPQAPSMASALAEFDTIASPPAKAPASAPKPPEGGKTPEPPKPSAVTPPKPEPKGEAQLRKRLAEVERERDQIRTKNTTEITTLQDKMKVLESKRYWTPEEEKRYKTMEDRQQTLEAELYTRDYRASPEFTEKFQKRADRVFDKVNKELKGMTVKYQDGEEDKTRAANIADFTRIRALNDSLSEQRKLAKSLFGEDADIVLSHARELSTIEEEANEEIATRQKTYAETRKQAEERQANEAREYQNHRTTFEKQIIEKYPQHFGEDPANPEVNEALKQGLGFIDATIAGAGKMNVEERAMKNSLVRLMAGSWQRNIVRIRQLESKIEELTGDLGKLRKSDPGSGGAAPPLHSGVALRPKGIEGMAAEFDKIPG